MKLSVKKIICLIMALVFAMALCGCKEDPNCGTYVCKKVGVENINVEAGAAFVNGATIELKKAGACDVTLDGVTYAASWKRNENEVTIDLQETESTGKLDGNTLTIDLFGVGMELTFEKQ